MIHTEAMAYRRQVCGDQVKFYHDPVTGERGLRYEDLLSLLRSRPDAKAIERRLWDQYQAASWLLFPEAVMEQAWQEMVREGVVSHPDRGKLLPFHRRTTPRLKR